jgi:hypothetical protein
VRSSISWAETKFEATSVLRRASVASDSLAEAWALARSGARLQQLLVEVGGLDLGDHLTGLDPGADVDVPALQITRHAREDRCAGIGFEPARQIDGRAQRLGARQRHGDGGNGLLIGPLLELAVLLLTGADSGADDQSCADQCNHAEYAQFPAGHRGALFSGLHAESPMRRRLWRLASCVPY